MNKRALLILIAALLCGNTFAQKNQSITVDVEGHTFDQFVLQIEKQSTYHFYYNHEWTDSVKLSLHMTDVLEAVLTKAMEGTDLKFAIDNRSVFITKERSILTTVPDDIFEGAPRRSSPRTDFDYSDYEKRIQKIKTAEEKLYTIGVNTGNSQGTAIVAGTVVNGVNGEPVIGASIFVEDQSQGVGTDQSGFYSLTITRGRHTLRIGSLGMKTTKRQVLVYGNGKLNVELEEDVTPLKEVVVESDRDARVMTLQMGTERLDIKTMKQMPSILGETDVLKVVLTLPGVQTVGEGASGVNIRGGSTNQNLILFNDAVVYNPSHLFGFFSAFNPDILKNVELYKSGITADYGGRLSSVIDVTTREGNLKKFSASGGISPITARLMVEGPIKKDQTSFLIGGRTTYSNWILRQIDDPAMRKSNAGFYDFNIGLNHKFNDKNSLQLSGYQSRDHFRLNSDTLYEYGEKNASLKYKHVFSNKLYGIMTGSVSRYNYHVSSDENPVEASAVNFSIQQMTGKADFSYFLNPKQTITAGAQLTRYDLSPGSRNPLGTESTVIPKKVDNEQGLESAVYIGENFDVNTRLSFYAGLRYSFYQYLGERHVFNYASEVSRSEETVTDTVLYRKGQPIASYHGAEPRFSLRYLVGKTSSFKVSYNRMRQYIQMITNSTAIAPTDIWKLSDRYLRPQVGDQFAVGYYRNMKNGMFELSLEAYYKKMQNALDYKDGAVLLLNQHLETDALNAEGKAYGAEFMLKKPAGKLNGWISYTYSRTFLRTNSPFASEQVNHGKFYPSNYDKPHAANVITNYKFNRRFNFSLNMTYSTGRPITIPLGKYELNGVMRTFYSERNAFRIPDYFRTDLSVNVEGNHKIKKLAHSSWTFAIYNVTGRKNAYSVFFVSEDGQIKGYKLSVFAQPIPTITYNFRF